MASFYTSAHLLETKGKDGKRFQGVLKYQVPNPDYVEDTRPENQRRKATGRRPNPDYVEDMRTPEQRKRNITKTVRKVFDPEAVKTKSQANEALVKWRAKMEAEHAAPDAGKTVSEYVADYISGRERQGDIEPSSLLDYRRTAKRLEYGEGAAIGGVIMRELTPRQVQAWERALFARGLKGTTVLKSHRLLKQVCKHAVEIDDLPKSPVRGFKAPSLSTGKPNALDAEGRGQVMRALDNMEPSPMTIAVELALYTGMRRAEICALTWGNVDLKGVVWSDAADLVPKLRVAQAFGDDEHGKYLKTPKTKKGRRVILLDGGIVRTLKARRALMWHEWADAMRQMGLKPKESLFNALYVVGSTNGKSLDPDKLSKQWHALAIRLEVVGTEGRTPTLQDLRHSAATMLITRGVDVSTVADTLGHEQVSTTLNMYTSKDNKAKRHAAMVAASDLDAARAGDVLPFVPKTGTDN